ncbi:hypothetical protein GJU94_03535 [Brucella sp. 10RB9214]|uniref:hypothetical protein n=1 Tax=unclassified Brucella TaxID=2632610 RepID=UPI00097291FA|nr:hypothetical protein BKD03_14625 [Brucella sp. 09RB8471]APY14465.1 hypothetical protein BKD02_09515 [Brucella sp. 09RB8910]MRN48024.1 hypothetical protein [Brucella sp. 10RB9212]MRN48907.1 hypothetical protein [Brucella sp. 10RB9214]MRN79712.1 hypothetical protein [Brucella sp. 10RB9210]
MQSVLREGGTLADGGQRGNRVTEISAPGFIISSPVLPIAAGRPAIGACAKAFASAPHLA